MPITALYERLSKDDGTPGESVSIRNQREYLETYAARNGHIPFTHFSDDGYSGTTFRRPAFRNMIRMIEKGEVDTVIVRDLSRFGRNYREAGFYLEKIFPAYHVRFIAVLNQVDTGENQNDFSIPLFNMISDWYSRDLSRRKKNGYRHRNNAGQRTSVIPLYGFLCDPRDRNNWQIDEPAAVVLRKIYRWYLTGSTFQEISRRLNEEGTLIPNDYYLIRGWSSRHSWRKQTHHEWDDRSFSRYFTNEEYKGTMVLGKEQEPKKFEHTHAAILSPENWEILQRRRKIHYPYRIPGMPPLLRCGVCHRRLTAHDSFLECRNPTCIIGRILPINIAQETSRILQETLWNSIPDKKNLLRKVRTLRQKNTLRKQHTSREFTSILEDRLYTISQHMIHLYEEDMDEDLRTRLLSAYQEEEQLIRNVHPPQQEQEQPLQTVFLSHIHAFVTSIDVTPQCILIRLSTNIPQPPPRKIQTTTIHFVPSPGKSPTSLILQLLQDDLL